jgi:hypothetical protein
MYTCDDASSVIVVVLTKRTSHYWLCSSIVATVVMAEAVDSTQHNQDTTLLLAGLQVLYHTTAGYTWHFLSSKRCNDSSAIVAMLGTVVLLLASYSLQACASIVCYSLCDVHA